MTANQIAYARQQEEVRHNLETERIERAKLGLSEKDLELKGYLTNAQVSYYSAQGTAATMQAEASRQNALTNAMDAATRRMTAESNIRLNEANINRIENEIQIAWGSLANDTIRAKASQTSAYAAVMSAQAAQTNAAAAMKNAETNRINATTNRTAMFVDAAYKGLMVENERKKIQIESDKFRETQSYNQRYFANQAALLEQSGMKLDIDWYNAKTNRKNYYANVDRNDIAAQGNWINFAGGLIGDIVGAGSRLAGDLLD